MSGKLIDIDWAISSYQENRYIEIYLFKLPYEWKPQNVFHILLLKQWNESEYVEEPTHFGVEIMYEVEWVLMLHKWRVKKWAIQEFLTVWTGFPLEDVSWEPENQFSNSNQLKEDIDTRLII